MTEHEREARADPKIATLLKGKVVERVIVVPGKVVNFITKKDPNVHMTQFSWDELKKAALEGEPRHRYLPNISFAVNYYFGAEKPFGYHLANLGFHLLTGIFLFFLFNATLRLCTPQDDTRLSGNRLPISVSPEILSFLAVMIWLVHPVQTNAVTYICQRMASMVAMFYILSLLCYVKGRINFRKKKTTTAGLFFFGCIFSGCCAVATKENAGPLPDRKSTRLNSSHVALTRLPSSA